MRDKTKRNLLKSDAKGILAAATELVSGFLTITTTVLIFACGPFAWALRDGFKNGEIESTGFEAISRMFWCFDWGPIVLVLMATTMWARRFNRR